MEDEGDATLLEGTLPFEPKGSVPSLSWHVGNREFDATAPSHYDDRPDVQDAEE
jgi:hypothetical protein